MKTFLVELKIVLSIVLVLDVARSVPIAKVYVEQLIGMNGNSINKVDVTWSTKNAPSLISKDCPFAYNVTVESENRGVVYSDIVNKTQYDDEETYQANIPLVSQDKITRVQVVEVAGENHGATSTSPVIQRQVRYGQCFFILYRGSAFLVVTGLLEISRHEKDMLMLASFGELELV